MNMKMNTGPDIHRDSQRLHRHPFAMTAKPLRRGPSAGALKAAATQAVRAYGRFVKEYLRSS